ncbi:hypothetical protein [Hymenobacter nivis]|uniref:hypothetical protein n=1 Tax=Hymenobacter nivis TaxID=1850093 RepID=UPI0013A5824D|nr:hypothetical protein [Hymenobacter nivis]
MFRFFAARLACAAHGDGEPFFLFAFSRPCFGRFAARRWPGPDDLRWHGPFCAMLNAVILLGLAY